MPKTSLCLIPTPASYDEATGSFSLGDGLSIALSHAAERGEWIAAQELQRVLLGRGLAVPIQPLRRCRNVSNTVVLAVHGRDEGVFPATSALSAVPDQPYVDGGTDNTEGYTLTVADDCIAVWGASPAGLSRGVQTLRQILSQVEGAVSCLRISDAPAFRLRGVMLDVSRGKVPTLATLFHLVDMISSWKLNMLQLYVEDTFAFRSHPAIGREWGALTPEEVVALDTYCRDRYVDLVPCLQSFGHMRRILELPEYAHLAESGARWSVAPVLEESYALLDDMYADHLACFGSAYINVCSDETYDLGMGQSRERAESVGRGRLFLEHATRLHQLAASHGRTMMIWDDMFLHYPELLAQVPKDAVLLNWWYEALDHYPQVDVVHDAGLRQIVCPGTSSWGTLFPRLDNARVNIRAMAADGKRCGALGVLNTDWGDNGHPNLLGNSWYGYAYGAAESWAPGRVDDATFETGFARLFFGPEEAVPALAAMHALNQACQLPGLGQTGGSRALSMCFGDPLVQRTWDLSPEQVQFMLDMLRLHGMPMPEGGIEAMTRGESQPVPAESLTRMGELASDALNGISSLRGTNPEAALTLEEMRLAARQIRHTGKKTLLGQQIAAAPEGENLTMLAVQLTGITREAHDLRRDYERAWLSRNKPQGMWLTLDQLASAQSALERWGARVTPKYGWGQ
jgi:hexosaminidase